MLLGIALHASIAYNGLNWAVSDASGSKIFVWFFHATHGFRMQLFFLISGFFTAMLYEKRGLTPLLQQRLKRILIPLLLFTPIFAGLTEWVLEMNESRQGIFDQKWQHFSFHHLWFLWFLCIYVLFFAMISKLPRLHLKSQWLESPSCFLWILPLTLIPQSFFTTAYPLIGPETSAGFIPIPEVLAYYAIFYAVGVALFQTGDALVTRGWKLQLALGLLLFLPASVIIERLTFSHYSHLKLLSDLIQVTFTWLMVFGCMGFFRAKFHHPSPVMRYLSDASYWLYLAHLPLVFLLQLLILDFSLNCWIKFTFVNIVSFVVLLVSYHYCVRYTPIGTLLNGKMTK